jgi:hypothetical protein
MQAQLLVMLFFLIQPLAVPNATSSQSLRAGWMAAATQGVAGFDRATGFDGSLSRADDVNCLRKIVSGITSESLFRIQTDSA